MLEMIAVIATIAAGVPAGAPSDSYVGLYDGNDGKSEFSPGAGPRKGEIILLSGRLSDAALVIETESKARPRGARAPVLFLALEGAISAPGAYGAQGAYEREIRVIRVIEARPADAADFARCGKGEHARG